MSTKNLQQREAHEKYLELARGISTAMMLTDLGSRPVPAIPMSPKRVEDNGDILFLSNATSEHNRNIERDGACQLLFSNTSGMEFLSVYGSATVKNDSELIKELFSKMDKAWFKGEDDPAITVIRFTPETGHYWDTKSNAIVTLAKLGYTAITGNPTDVGASGDLNL